MKTNTQQLMIFSTQVRRDILRMVQCKFRHPGGSLVAPNFGSALPRINDRKELT
jgi:hypothetical protein